MKKIMVLLFLVLSLCLIGCDLNFLSGTVYFYELAGDGNEPSDASLRYRKDGYTIIMSRGSGGESGWDTKEGAEGYKEKTTFTLKLDGKDISPIEGSKSVAKLGKNRYHVVESFELKSLPKGTHTLEGKTTFTDHSGGTRTNVVTLTIN
ncbi:MAG: hypothetical protein RBQ79_05490 [Sphaerochaetaceae bacterium]|jgi:hypothetical protein|nr:hypothetical protein [Sphaerochaetaceae bacterium]